MEDMLQYWSTQITSLDFWKNLLDSFEGLGPLVPVLLAMVESFVPPLPLIAIVALNVAAHGPVMGFLYSWCGVVMGGAIMFTFWRRVVKRFFWRFASRFEPIRKAERWVSHCDVPTLFTLAMLPFTPTSFLHLAFGISDFDSRRYILTLLAGKAVMIAMMALFGQSLTNALENSLYLVLAVLLWVGMYFASKLFCQKHHLD